MNNAKTNKSKEYIYHELGHKDAWQCICGNTDTDYGFYPCDKDGNEMEPLIGSDWNGLYICHGCFRIIDMDTLEVVGIRKKTKSRIVHIED